MRQTMRIHPHGGPGRAQTIYNGFTKRTTALLRCALQRKPLSHVTRTTDIEADALAETCRDAGLGTMTSGFTAITQTNALPIRSHRQETVIDDLSSGLGVGIE